MNLTIHAIQYNGTGVPPIDLTVDAGGISIGGDTNQGGSVTHTVTVTDNSSVEISVTQDGYHTYNMTIDNVYDSDRTIYIMMVDIISDINDPDYNRPNAYHFYFTSPCSFKTDFYSASSFTGEIEWYSNNELYARGNKGTISHCNPGKYQIKQRCTVSGNEGLLWDRQWANTDEPIYTVPGEALGQGETGNVIAGDVAPLSTYLDLDLQTNITLTEYRPDFDLILTAPVNQLESLCCYTKDEELTIIADITLNRTGALPDDHTVTFTVTSPNGLPVELQQDTFTLLENPISISFPLNELGQYTITGVLDDLYCGSSYTVTKIADTCNFFDINYTDCSTYEFVNKSTDKNVSMEIVNIEGTESYASELTPGTAETIVFNEISIYFVTITYLKDTVETQEVYVLNNYCILEDCIAKYISDLLCVDERRCNPCPDDVELNMMLLLSYSYFNKLHSEYAWNNFYSGISDSKLNEFNTLKQNMDRLKEFCSRRGCIAQAFPTCYTSEGPYDWAGKNDPDCNCNVNLSSTTTTTSAYYTSTCKTCGS
jgi:hypothetical protein